MTMALTTQGAPTAASAPGYPRVGYRVCYRCSPHADWVAVGWGDTQVEAVREVERQLAEGVAGDWMLAYQGDWTDHLLPEFRR